MPRAPVEPANAPVPGDAPLLCAATRASAFVRIRKRADFKSAARASRKHSKSFTLQMKRRADCGAPARFGLTVTKKTAPQAVKRNRIRRRLREALRLGAARLGETGADYVFVARIEALAAPFSELQQEIAAALISANKSASGKHRRAPL